MKSRLKKHLTPPLFISLIALAVALSGTAYAVTQLPKNSVGPQQIRSGAVKTSKLGQDVKRKLAGVGARGPRGLQGEIGPHGVAGPTGSDGTQGLQGLTGPAGMVNWTGVYEVQEARTGTGVVTATCTGNDQVLFGTTEATDGYSISNAGRGNGGREWSVTFQTSPMATARAIAYCVPNP